MDLVRKGEAIVHIVPTTAYYLRFLAILVSGAYAPVVLMPHGSLGGAKNYRYQQYFVPLEINKVLFHSITIAFLLHQ